MDQSNYLPNQKQRALNKYEFIRLFQGSYGALKLYTYQGPCSRWVDSLNWPNEPHPRFPVQGHILGIGGDALIACPIRSNLTIIFSGCSYGLLHSFKFDNLFSPIFLVRVTFIHIWEYIFRFGSTNSWACEPAREILDEVHKSNWMILPEHFWDPEKITLFQGFQSPEGVLDKSN